MAKKSATPTKRNISEHEAFMLDYFSEENLETARYVQYEGGNPNIIRYTVKNANGGITTRVDDAGGMPDEWVAKLREQAQK